jgi:hypothetical protein
VAINYKEACNDHGWGKGQFVVGLWYATTALLDLAQNALDADRKRWLFAVLVLRQMSPEELGR